MGVAPLQVADDFKLVAVYGSCSSLCEARVCGSRGKEEVSSFGVAVTESSTDVTVCDVT